jgi:hypothetical protein
MRVSRAETTLNYVILLAFAAFALAPVLTILATSVSAPLGRAAGCTWRTSPAPGRWADSAARWGTPWWSPRSW